MSTSIYSTQLLQTSATHRYSLVGFADSVWNRIGEGMAMAASATSFHKLAQSSILRALKQFKHGHLHVIVEQPQDAESSLLETVYTFGEGGLSPNLEATLRVRRPAFWLRVLLASDMGFAEAFMYGDVECDEIPSFLRLFVANKEEFKVNFPGSQLAASFLATPSVLTALRFLGDITTTRANISAHYDIGNDMFTAFLSEDMNYSSAIWKDFNEDIQSCKPEKPLESLEDAQMRKMLNLIRRTDIREGHRVLEVGTGWGALSILAVQKTNCTIDTLTLSSEQKILAEERIARAGLSDRIQVHLMDYREVRNIPEWEHAFDRFVSVEMMEHVGKEYFEAYWSVVDWALKEKDAVGCVQVITLPENRVKAYDGEIDFIRKWIFPGGYIPSLNLLISSMTSGSQGRLTTDHVSNIGPHYARTLREWKRRFQRNFETVIARALREKYTLKDEDVGIFKRKWLYYFDYCEVGFATRLLGDHIISFTRENNISLGCTWDDYDKLSF